MAKNRNIDFFYARGKDKVEFLEMLCQKYSTTPEHIAYVGDDLFDKNIMKAIKYPFCPSDSVMDIKAICGFNNILSKNGGENVVMELVDLLLKKKLINDATLEQIEALDKNEKF
jgi:3-deoxy-D-manno-octulosonate 8-phosphate phosphatase (KDO 8-P phosphatase)